METSSQQSGRGWQAFLDQYPEFKKQFNSVAAQLRKKPQLILAGVVAVFLLIGVVASVGLVGVEQDIRQQAAASLYTGVLGRPCGYADGVMGCDNSNNKLVCLDREWRALGQSCVASPVSSGAPQNPPVAQPNTQPNTQPPQSSKCNNQSCPGVWVVR